MSAADLVPVPLYHQFVVVAETEWKCEQQESGNRKSRKISMMMGLVEWNVHFDDDEKKHTSRVHFSCQNVHKGTADEVHLELVAYHRSNTSESYQPYDDYKEAPMRHLFNQTQNKLTLYLNAFFNVFTFRILKDRSKFPDFTLESTFVGHIGTNGKLRVGDQVFHVNKQMLSMHSEHFDRMYNGAYKEANLEVVELKHDQADPAMFHDFLMVMCVNDALPNSNNVAALCDLAKIYQVNFVRDKCLRHLSVCREIPAEERYMLAGELGSEELQTSIRRDVANLEEADRIIVAATKKAFSLTP